uniref:Uncharacterized protein n=1 Tax=Chenopodium quinoa TaxID=63459 RepID=A0A803MIU6_CHEQI
MLGTIATIAGEEGLPAFWKGIVPGLHRQCQYGGLRIGLYEPIEASAMAWRCWPQHGSKIEPWLGVISSAELAKRLGNGETPPRLGEALNNAEPICSIRIFELGMKLFSLCHEWLPGILKIYVDLGDNDAFLCNLHSAIMGRTNH